MKRANGMGTIVKLKGNRRRPYAIRRVVGWKENGRPILKYVSYHHTYREAERALNEYNNDPYTISKTTLHQLYEEWFKVNEPKMSDATIAAYTSYYHHLKPLYNVKVKDIDRIMLQQFLNDLNVSKNTLQRVISLFNKLFDHAVRRAILPQSALNMTKQIIIPSKEVVKKDPRKAISAQDIDRLWVLKDTNEYARIALVYIYTGLRYSELADLQPEQCHEDYIEIGKAKTPAGVRIVPLCDKVKSILPIIKVPAHTSYYKKFKEILPEYVPHDTRHTFVTMLTEKGVDPRIIKAIVGHKPTSVTDIYTHIRLDVLLEAVNRL